MTILAVFLGVALATSVDLQDQVDKLERRLHDSIEDAHKQAKKEAEMETALKEMEERLERLGANMEKARQLYPQVMLDGFDADADGTDDMTGKLSYIPEITTAMGTTWTIICGALVMFMHAGFALLETGVCRAVSCQSILLKNILNVCFGTLIWFTFGYAFMYGGAGEDPKTYVIGGKSKYFGSGLIGDDGPNMFWNGPNQIVDCQDWFFQWAFCVTAATIVSGGVAERLQLGGYIIFTTWMTGVIYPTVGAMTWGYGFLYDMGYSDFAGSGIVHLTGGIGALAGAAVTGARKQGNISRFDAEGANPDGPYAPHNVPNAALGTFILWFGWYGFNCGSTLYMTGFADAGSAGLVAVNTTIAPAMGGIAALLLRRFVLQPKALSVTPVCGGILAGLVSITAGCGNIHPRATILVGFVGGCVYCLASDLLQKLKVDDPVEAFAVHGAGGIWGVLAVPLFDIGTLAGTNEDFVKTLIAQVTGIITIVLWSGILSTIMFTIIKTAKLLRVDAEHETIGIDQAEFSPKNAYNQKKDPFAENVGTGKI